jgi:hypothetical protein
MKALIVLGLAAVAWGVVIGLILLVIEIFT